MRVVVWSYFFDYRLCFLNYFQTLINVVSKSSSTHGVQVQRIFSFSFTIQLS